MAMNDLGPEHFAKLFPTLKVENRLSHGLEETWSARELRQQKATVLKAFRLGSREDWEDLAGLRRDVWALAQFKHPAVPKVFEERESEIDGYDIYIVLESFEGSALEYWQERDEIALRSIADELLVLLNEMHNAPQPLVHRDLTPENIVEVDNQLKLINFGMVKALKPKSEVAQARWRHLSHAQRFIAPDIDRGSKFIDFYGLGVTMVYLATGKTLVDLTHGEGDQGWEEHIVNELSQRFREWINRCLETDAEKRFMDASHALAALRMHWSDGLVKAFEDGFLEVETPPSRLVVKTKKQSPETTSRQLTVGVLGFILGAVIWPFQIIVSLMFMLAGTVGIVWAGFDFFRVNMELSINRDGWMLTQAGARQDYGALENLEGRDVQLVEGVPRLIIKRRGQPDVQTKVEVDERELPPLNALLQQFKKSLR